MVGKLVSFYPLSCPQQQEAMFGLSIGNGWSSCGNFLVSLLLIGTSRWGMMTRALSKYCHPSITQVRSLSTPHTQLRTLHS